MGNIHAFQLFARACRITGTSQIYTIAANEYITALSNSLAFQFKKRMRQFLKVGMTLDTA